jgi:membrane protein
MIALVFLYVTASIFIYGGELNAAIWRASERRKENHPLTTMGRHAR